METREWFEQLQRQAKASSEARGEAIGRRSAVARIAEKRLGRPLTEAEQATLSERLDRFGEDRMDEVLLDSSAQSLAAWLADPGAR